MGDGNAGDARCLCSLSLRILGAAQLSTYSKTLGKLLGKTDTIDTSTIQLFVKAGLFVFTHKIVMLTPCVQIPWWATLVPRARNNVLSV